jgi:hypothetical protein
MCFTGEWCAPWAHNWSLMLTAVVNDGSLSAQTWSCCGPLPRPRPWAAGSQKSELMLLLVALFRAAAAGHLTKQRWGPRRCFCWAGSCLLCLSRGCWSSRLCFVYLPVSRRRAMALRWALPVPFFLFYVVWCTWNFILVVNYVLFIFE